MSRALYLCAALAIAGTASAQTTSNFVLPAGSEKTNTSAYEYLTLTRSSSLPVRYQSIYKASEFTKSAGSLQQIAFRRNNYYGNSVPAGSTTLTITIGYSPNAASTTFANNLAQNPKVFYKGTMNWPAAPKGTGPAPFTHVVKPASPFVFVPNSVPNGTVCVESMITATTFGNSTYILDSITPDVGLRSTNGRSNSSCKFSNNKYNNSISYTTAGLLPQGGNWYVQYRNLLPNAPGIATISFFGTNQPGPWPLPIDMTPLGATSCHWDVGLETGLWVPMNADASGNARWPNLTIPKTKGGWSFFDQGLWLDTAANPGGLVAGWSSEWYVGTNLGPRGATIYRQQYANETTGYRLSYEEVMICQFTY